MRTIGYTVEPMSKAESAVPASFPSPLVIEGQGFTRTPLVGGLSSAIVHMLLLTVLGLLFVKIDSRGSLELEMTIANTSADESLESLAVDIEASFDQPAETNAVDRQPLQVELKIDEPALVTNLEAVAASDDDFDPTRGLQDPVDAPAGQKAGDQSDTKGTFFGAHAYGDDFVYVVDMSTSMGYRSEYGQTRFRVACRELLRSINELNSDQKFCVIMFCYRTRVMFDSAPRLIAATKANKQRIANWIASLGLGAGTDPRFGTMLALKLKPDAVFLLSDGEFNGRDVNAHGIPGNVPIERIIANYRKSIIPIHTIAFEDVKNRRRLRRIASGSAGTHRFVGNVSDQDLVISDLGSQNASDVVYAMQCLIDGTHKLRDNRHLLAAAQMIASKFTSREPALREKAHHTMLALADGDDVAPLGDFPQLEDYAQAQRDWLRYWANRVRGKRTEEQQRPDVPELAGEI